MIAVNCIDISKSYGTKKVLKNLNLTMESGRIYGLLGLNGAGKTTLFNLITNRCFPNKGSVELYGVPVGLDEAVIYNTCFVSNYMKSFSGLRITDIFRRAARVYPRWDKKYASDLLSQFGLSRRLTYDKSSSGQTTAVGLIIGLASGCDLVLMDEIYSGLDAVARTTFYKALLENYERTHRTFILSSHLIEEMDQLFTDVVLISDGRVLINETYENLIESSYTITGRQELTDYLPDQNILGVYTADNFVKITAYGNDVESYFDKLREHGASIEHASLNDLFVAMTEEE